MRSWFKEAKEKEATSSNLADAPRNAGRQLCRHSYLSPHEVHLSWAYPDIGQQSKSQDHDLFLSTYASLAMPGQKTQ